MSTIMSKPRLTAGDLLVMPDGKHFELIDGQLVEKTMGAESSWIGGLIFNLLSTYCQTHRLGWVFPADCGFQCFPGDPNLVRKPDVSFIRADRLRGQRPPRIGFLRIAPDLAVEVLSPNDLATDVDPKVRQFLEAGTRLVWVVNPETDEVRIHRADRSITGLQRDEELTGEDVVPGFRCLLGELFPPADPPAG
jgi:Uma2 family endonuclease